ncbi:MULTISPECIES: hypothetical protein [unclassified Pseudoclavibacter]|uniref:hypothetical protein n=1 Tax=unclassified Pseudoclavibacter TaxID=2615177 RepID=UPI001BA796E8|nr:hypothetical protein [Pseudoclavibacter sp. Marseille-Q4354]MBS3180041.1 hypothetical protein [Pseudoclavibacter sp. Marseille-Q4354]
MTNKTKTRTRVSAAALAFFTLAGVAIAASPAQAIEPDSPEGAIVLPNSSTGEISSQLRGFCHAKILSDPVQTDFEIVKKDPTGVPIEGVEFTIDFQANAASTHAISLDSWQEVRSPDLEATRVDAEHALYAADTAVNDYRRDFWHPASNALSTAKSDLSYAETVLAGGSTPEREQAVVDAQAAVDEAQAALDAMQPEMDALTQVAADARTAAVAAAQAISDQLMADAEVDTLTVTTDAEGRIVLPTYYCSGGGDGGGDRWIITETAVPEGVDPAGVGAELVLSSGYGNHVESAVRGVDGGGVYTAAEYTEESTSSGTSSGTWRVDAVNELLPEEPTPTPTRTPEEPTPTPTAPAPTPVKEVQVTPSTPALPPIVSG